MRVSLDGLVVVGEALLLPVRSCAVCSASPKLKGMIDIAKAYRWS